MLTVKNTFKLFDVLNKHFKNDTDSRTCIAEIEEIMDNKVDLKMNNVATTKDLGDMGLLLKEEMFGLRSEVKQEISGLRSEVKEEISGLRSEVKEEISGLRSEVNQKISALRTEVTGEISALRSEFKQEMNDFKTEFKSDLSLLRTDFHVLKADINVSLGNSALSLEKSQKEQLRWIIGAMVAIFGLIFSIFIAILNIF